MSVSTPRKRRPVRPKAPQPADVKARQARQRPRPEAQEVLRRLAESEDRLALALDSSRSGVFDWDVATGQVRYAHTRAFAESALSKGFGRAAPVLPDYGIVPSSDWELATHPDDVHLWRGVIEAAVAGVSETFTTVTRRRTSDGGWQWVEARGKVAARDAHGRATRIVGTFENVNEGMSDAARRRRIETALFQGMRLTAVAEVASALSHEVNQPLAVAMSRIQAAERLVRQGRPPRKALLAALCDAAGFVERAGETLKRFRQLASSRAAERETFDIAESARRIAGMVEPDARRMGIGIAVEEASGPRRVVADRVQIEQVLLNLVQNAIDSVASAESGPRIVTIHVWEADERVRVRVTDSGTGVPEAVRDSLFAPFFTTKPTGTGLGLPISRTIAEAHGGRLVLECGEPGRTSFLLTLP